jgi:carboxymethylenebutenolidase
MSGAIELKAADGHVLAGWLCEPAGEPLGGIVVLQEIFGLTGHIRRVTEGYAKAGYLAVAPALFDRVERGVELDYSDLGPGVELMSQTSPENTVLDMQAALDAVSPAGASAAVGYCWGGSMADLAACKLDLSAAVSYYGGSIMAQADLVPSCPVMYHFGALDSHIPMDVVDAIRGARPDGEFHVYDDAGHGFNCDDRPDFHPASAELALERSLSFLARHMHK